MDPEAMLRATGEDVRSFDAKAWDGLLHYAIACLSEWLGHAVETDKLLMDNAGGFCVDIVKARPGENDLVHWKGILGASIIDDRIRVCLFVFPYSGSHRLLTRDGKEYAEFVLEPGPSSRAEWKLFGWFKDEYGEFEGRFE